MKEQYFSPNNIFEKASEIKNKVHKNFYPQKSLSFDKDKVVLLVTDMQNYFISPESHAYIPSVEAIIPNIKLLIKTCINFDIPVIFTQHINNKENAGMMDLWWNDIISESNPLSKINTDIYIKNSVLIKKSQYDSFHKTELEKTLIQLNKNQLIICGLMTNLCCETTVRSAFVKGFKTFFPIDATAAYNYDFHLSTFQNLAFGFTPPILTKDLINLINI